jgi:thiamine-phosphate diphosphorylase
MMPLARSRNLICLVTDRRRLSPPGNDLGALDRLVELAGAAGRAGIDLIQVRERDLEACDLVALATRCVAAVSGTNARILVNDRADVAMAAGAHGVHLRRDSVEALRARELVPSDYLVGRSVHSVEEATGVARAGGLDYLILGTMFPTLSKDAGHPLTGMTELAGACAAVTVPILAIGGMTLKRAEEAARMGAAGIAAIGLFLPPPGTAIERHVRDRVTELRRVFDTCGAVP